MDNVSEALTPRQEEILAEVARILDQLVGEEWLTDVEIGATTSFAEDLSVESIEMVAMAEAIHGRYGEQLNLAGWFSEMELDEVVELTVGDLVRYIDEATS